MKDIKDFHLRMPVKLMDRINIQAEKESRSITSEILELLRRGLDSDVTRQLVIFED